MTHIYTPHASQPRSGNEFERLKSDLAQPLWSMVGEPV